MSKAVEEILKSIIEEFKACRPQAAEELEAKSLFRLLNYCPPSAANVPPQENPKTRQTSSELLTLAHGAISGAHSIHHRPVRGFCR